MNINSKNKNKIKDQLVIVRVLLIALLILGAVISIYPFVYMLILSMMKTNTMKLDINRIMNAQWTTENYTKVFKEANFLMYFKNSAITTFYAVVVNCLTSAMAAYAFAKKKFQGKNGIYIVYLATMMIPSQVTLIPCFLILKSLGMLNTFSAVALPSCGAFGVLLIHSFMDSIPNDLLEAADIDGCGELKKFTRIVLPLIKPVIISLAIFTFISVWGSLVLPLIVNTKHEMTTLTVAIANMKTNKMASNYGFIMAASTVSFLPPFILYLFLQKQFVEGIALSGTKM